MYLFDKNRLLIIAGPCVMETPELCEGVAKKLAEFQKKESKIQIIFKSSFDKANRARLEGARGMGMQDGLALLAHIRKAFGLPITTDVHLPDQCQAVGEVCDVLQIPAFLCRQTDLLVAAAKTGKVVNVKKGQFLSPMEMESVVDKIDKAGAKEIWQTDRGTTFGYQNLVVDMRSFPIMAKFRTPTILDATHAVQRPGAGTGGQSGGEREYVPFLAKAAIAAGANGLFIETHPDPAKAHSDAASQWPLDQFESLIEQCLKIWECVRAE
jgi:2-dehydro-3-deoxyphosphooctonate aldolase (KDO 8-P synthase)